MPAYCLPFRDRNGTGCFLNVAKAEPGSDVWFDLESNVGERAEPHVRLDPTATSGYKYFYLPASQEHQANFTGFVMYEEAPHCSWPVKTSDPSADRICVGELTPADSTRKYHPCRTKMTMYDGKLVSFLTYFPLIRLQKGRA
ncbi:hypothetical protein QBZ16_005528 [Prototheca wickerhamii]|uniref:Uncharacterized protein n=1 Tax=Prototheca wickerhamii TaxID=3111 RepID=A0AAD9IFP2_PROWI|nr:hypothetical protein QBZ16_005528 [Prototheca wickerhamii]